MSETWYKDGLKFSCTGCGKCCTGEPGYVWVEQEEIEKMAAYLKISVKEFIQTHTRQVNGQLSLREDPQTFDCIFLQGGKFCSVYGARPKQCRTFPFWPEVLESKETWEACKQRCEGIDHEDAPLITLKMIQDIAD